MLPPRVAAPENVTKSFKTTALFVSDTVIVEEPFVAAKVTSPAEVVCLIGVMSTGLLPSKTYSFKLVPALIKFVPSREIQL